MTDGNAATLENVDKSVSGSGLAYDTDPTLINDAQGKIEADYASSPLIVFSGSNIVRQRRSHGGDQRGCAGECRAPVAGTNSGTVAANGGNIATLSSTT